MPNYLKNAWERLNYWTLLNAMKLSKGKVSVKIRMQTGPQ